MSEPKRYVCFWCGVKAASSSPALNKMAIAEHVRECVKHPLRALTLERDKLQVKVAAAVAFAAREHGIDCTCPDCEALHT